LEWENLRRLLVTFTAHFKEADIPESFTRMSIALNKVYVVALHILSGKWNGFPRKFNTNFEPVDRSQF